jgi:hypothetical protein
MIIMRTVYQIPVRYLFLTFFICSAIIISCKKNEDAKLPMIAFKTGGNYTSSDASVNTSDLIKVGTTSDKNEADLKTFKIYSSVGGGAFSIKKTYYLTPDEKDHYENEYQFSPKNQYNFETWKFEITDANGNVNSVSFKLSVH